MKNFKWLSLIILLIVMKGTPITANHIKDRKTGRTGNFIEGKLLKGFQKEISGETINYHSPQPDANQALLVRSLDRKNYIE